MSLQSINDLLVLKAMVILTVTPILCKLTYPAEMRLKSCATLSRFQRLGLNLTSGLKGTETNADTIKTHLLISTCSGIQAVSILWARRMNCVFAKGENNNAYWTSILEFLVQTVSMYIRAIPNTDSRKRDKRRTIRGNHTRPSLSYTSLYTEC